MTPQTLRSLAASWPHEGMGRCKPDCRRCQLDALVDAMEAKLNITRAGLNRDYIAAHILGQKEK